MTRATVVRSVVLFLALANQLLVMLGFSPLPFDDAALEEVVSYAATVMASLIAWWKNNSFSREAVAADNYLSDMRRQEAATLRVAAAKASKGAEDEFAGCAEGGAKGGAL